MALYIVLSGLVRVERELDVGVPVCVAEMGAASFFGEMGLIDDAPRSATVVALEPTECALLSKWDFQNELRNDPQIAVALLPVLNERIRDLEARLTQAENSG
jgi:CRP-like cAMP-binding protein